MLILNKFIIPWANPIQCKLFLVGPSIVLDYTIEVCEFSKLSLHAFEDYCIIQCVLNTYTMTQDTEAPKASPSSCSALIAITRTSCKSTKIAELLAKSRSMTLVMSTNVPKYLLLKHPSMPSL